MIAVKISICRRLGVAAVRGCCCEMTGCNNPAPLPPPVKPNLECFVGYRIDATMNGGILKCPEPGLCANASITIGDNGHLVLYTCNTFRLCDAIGAGIGCSESILDGAIYACCCGATDSCNVGSGIQLPTEIPIRQRHVLASKAFRSMIQSTEIVTKYAMVNVPVTLQ